MSKSDGLDDEPVSLTRRPACHFLSDPHGLSSASITDYYYELLLNNTTVQQ